VRTRTPSEPAACAGIEFGGTKILCRIVADDGRVLAAGRFATATPAQAIEDVSACLNAALARHRLRALGVASFGPIVLDAKSARYGQLLATPKAGWSGFDVRGELLRRFPVPLVIDTDVNAAALAEQAGGAARGLPCVAYVTVGTGVGGGLALEGRTLKGALHPEIGHMRLRRRAHDRHVSTCPFHEDCAEGLASGPAVARRLTPGRTLAEDPEVLALVADYLGDLAANLVLAWSPHRIVLGGGVMGVPGLIGTMRASLRAALNDYGAALLSDPDYLAPAALPDAGLEGALLLARAAARPAAAS